MTRVLVVYYSALGTHWSHGPCGRRRRKSAGAAISIRRVPDIGPMSVAELEGARFQRHHVATLASRLAHKLAT